jgi:aryl-alcohol dehydrogenase-like predicted oxidoreductase
LSPHVLDARTCRRWRGRVETWVAGERGLQCLQNTSENGGDDAVRTKRLGNTDLQMTVIGLGTFAIGGPDWPAGWGPQDDRDSVATVRRAVEGGINWIDTAPVYGLGKAEEVVGEALRGMKEKPIIATKLGLVWDEKRNVSRRLKRESVRGEVEASLKRLDVDVIDLYQVHWPDPDEDLEEAWTAMAELADEGKVRYIGVSNCSVRQMERIQPIHPIASLQPPYSMIIRDVEEEILPYCGSKNIGVIPYSPMQRGLLTGKYTRETIKKLDPKDHRLGEPYFQEPQLSVNLKLVDALKPIAEKNGRSLAQLAIAWVRRRGEVTAAIVGARRPAQLEEITAAGDWELSGEDAGRIDELLKRRDKDLEDAGSS